MIVSTYYEQGAQWLGKSVVCRSGGGSTGRVLSTLRTQGKSAKHPSIGSLLGKNLVTVDKLLKRPLLTASSISEDRRGLNVQIFHSKGVCFDKLSSRLHLITHQGGKDLVGPHCILDIDPQ